LEELMSLDQDYSMGGAFMFRDIMRMLRPHRLKGAGKVRIGRHFDGGYTMLDRFDGIEAAYSLGINDEISWDLNMAQKGVKIFQYDHTIEGLPYDHPLFNWKRIGITGKMGEADNLATLESLIEANGHRGNRSLILKCDIEGAEWDMLMHAPNEIIRQFSQIVMELHNLHHVCAPGPADAVRKAIGNLYSSHKVVHVHANNYGGIGVVGGFPVPRVLEVTLARLDLGEFEISDESFPTAIDMPCNRDAADIYLGRFDFA
jgi:hypothetical protein